MTKEGERLVLFWGAALIVTVYFLALKLFLVLLELWVGVFASVKINVICEIPEIASRNISLLEYVGMVWLLFLMLF